MSIQGKLTLRNYRCFDWEHPAVLEFGDGFTAFVGSNNAGKSAALKAVYELRNIFNHVYNTLSPTTSFLGGNQPLGVADLAEIANDNDPTRFEFTLEAHKKLTPPNSTAWLAVEITFEYQILAQNFHAKSFNAIKDGVTVTFDIVKIRQVIGVQGNDHIQYQDGTLVDFSRILGFNNDLQQSRYFPAFRNAINEGAGYYYDLPIGTALVDTWDQWKAGNNRANKNSIIRVEKEIAELLGFQSLQINADKSGKTLDVIIDGRPQKLYEVGAGVAQLIIVLAAALVSKPPYILIDEPELSLHPALQLSFLATLGSYATKGLLYSTHSISLARSTAQRIYAVKKINNGSSQMHPYSDKAIHFGSWLGELSYSSRVELGCEGLLLVEGPTDVLVFQELLRKVNKDHKYVLMQLGGSSLINGDAGVHLSELNRIIDPSKIRVFIDSEKSSVDAPLAKSHADFVEACEEIGIKVHVAERRATENYFENDGIRNTLGSEFQALEPYQLLKTCPKPWHKSNNWRIARETKFENIKDTDLGKFLTSL